MPVSSLDFALWHCLCLQALARAGCGVHFVPVLQFVFTNEHKLFSALLTDFAGYSGIGCTVRLHVCATVPHVL